jgi:hypothetical protein
MRVCSGPNSPHKPRHTPQTGRHCTPSFARVYHLTMFIDFRNSLLSIGFSPGTSINPQHPPKKHPHEKNEKKLSVSVFNHERMW